MLKIESTNEATHRFEGSVGLIILILTCFSLSNSYLRFKNYRITRTFLLPAATAVYWKINALPAGNRPEITVTIESCDDYIAIKSHVTYEVNELFITYCNILSFLKRETKEKLKRIYEIG